MTNTPITQNPDRETRQFFENLNKPTLTFATNDVDAMVGYFESRGFSKQSSISTATVLLTQAKIDGINAFTLIDTLKGIDDVKLSAIVTEIVSYPKRRVLRFWLAGGNLNTLLKAEPDIVNWSKQYDCKGVEINGRKGWERVLKSYKPSSITLVKEI